MKAKTELWIILLTISFISTACPHKCTQQGGCGRPNFNRASTIAALTTTKIKPFPSHNTLLGRLSHRQTHKGPWTVRSPDMKQDNLQTKLMTVRSLADNMIKAQILKEGSIGIYIKEYMNSITVALSRLRDSFKAWKGETPTIPDFLAGVLLALDDLAIASPDVNDDLIRIRDLEFKKSTITTQTRLRFKYNHFRHSENISSHLRIPERLKTSSYDKINESDWWRPIIMFKEHLKYSELWMRFLEELNFQLESAESQLSRNELRMNFKSIESGMGYKIQNFTEVLERINHNFGLISLRNVTKEIIATANSNRLKYLELLLEINVLNSGSCTEINGIAHVVAAHLTTTYALDCTKTLMMNNSQINAVAFIGSVRFLIEQDLHVRDIRDTSLEFGKGFHLIMIAPEWVSLVGDEPGRQRRFWIPGRQAPDYSEKSKTMGEAGLRGEKGGRFYGFGIHVTGNYITVNMNGGPGGKGQDGGVKEECFVACFEDETDDIYACCKRHARFLFPGVDGGLAGRGADWGEKKLFLFTNESRMKFSFRRNRGKQGVVGLGHPYQKLKDGYAPSEAILKRSNIVFDPKKGYCVTRDADDLIYFPVSREMKDLWSGKDGASTSPRPPINVISFGPEKSAAAILMYKLWSLKHSHLFNTRRIRAFTSKTDMDDDFQTLLSTTDLIEEFNNLEKVAQEGNVDMELLKLSYQSIAFRTQLRAQNYTGENKEDHIKVLLFLNSAARSKMLAMTNPYEPILVVNMLTFLDAEKTRVGELKETVEEELQYQHITAAVASYNQMIQDHFKEADFLINSTINPEFDEIEMKMTQLAQVLLDKIKKLKEDEENNRDELINYRAMLGSHQAGNVFFNLLKLGGNVLGVLYPAAGAISVGVDLANAAFNPTPDKPGVTPSPVPEAVNSGNMQSALRFRKSTDYNIKGLTRQLKAIRMTIQTDSQYFPNTLNVLNSMKLSNFPRAGNDVEAPIDEFPPADCVLSFKLLMTTQGMIRGVKLNLSAAIKLDYNNAINEGESSRKLSNVTEQRLKNAAAVATTIAMGASSTYNQWQQDQDNIDEVTRAIQESEKRIMAYQEHIDRIENELLPDIDNMFKGLSDARQDLADLSSLALIVVRHTMQKTIRNAQLDYKKEFVEGTGLEDYFDRALQSTLDAMETLINIYERLDAYKEQGKLANFTAEVALHPKQYLGRLKDENMQKKFDELRYTLQGEILLKRQSLVEGAFRMWKFPMVDPVLCGYKNLSGTALDFSAPEKVYIFLDDMGRRIGDLIDFVKIAQSTVLPGDKYTLITEFTRRKEGGYPFYKWENLTSSGFIADMLKGRRTYLRSKENPGVPFCDAVKFQRITLSFGSPVGDQALESDLKLVLNDYLVTLIHTGNSFYFFANQSFVISTEQIELSFSFELDSQEVPILRNVVYDKLLTGDLTLSPYTTWLITIEPIDPKIGFKPLQKFARKVDLYLEGSGRCVKKKFAFEGKYVSPTCEDF